MQSPKPLNVFLGNFCYSLVTPISGYIIHCMSVSPSDPHLQAVQEFPQDFTTLFNQQTLRRIAGYSVEAI